jgi:hypothetical protein
MPRSDFRRESSCFNEKLSKELVLEMLGENTVLTGREEMGIIQMQVL